jgi:two-component system, sensor histidine kinase
MTEAGGPELMPRVVLIEDDPLVLFGQEMLLKDWGYRVVAGRSREAIRQALGDAPGDVAAIIADYNLGGEEIGADVARAVAESARRPIPTVVMSASLGRRSGAAAQLHGFALLTKPVDPEALHNWLVTATKRGD